MHFDWRQNRLREFIARQIAILAIFEKSSWYEESEEEPEKGTFRGLDILL